MHPDPVIRVPLHPLVHSEDERSVLIEVVEALGLRIGLTHVAEAIVSQRCYAKGAALEFEVLAGVAVHAVSALLGLAAGEHGIDQLLLPNEAVEAAGLLGVVHGAMLPRRDRDEPTRPVPSGAPRH